MSVQKFIVKKGSPSFTTIPNKVLQGIDNYELLGLYAYLISLPPEWEFQKTHLCKHGKVGIHKMERMLKQLEDYGLVRIAQIRDAQGRFSHFNMHVDDGELFKINKLDEDAQPCYGNRTTVTVLRSQQAINNIYTNKKENKENISYASNDAHNRFDDFWTAYPKKRDKARCYQLWQKKKLDDIADTLLDDIQRRIKNDAQWQDVQYIPYPTTYLNGKRWEDEITQPKKETKPISIQEVDRRHANEVTSNVKFWEPGNPDYDRAHGIE